MYCTRTMSADLSCLSLYINWPLTGCVLCSNESGNVMHPGAWLQEHRRKRYWGQFVRLLAINRMLWL